MTSCEEAGSPHDSPPSSVGSRGSGPPRPSWRGWTVLGHALGLVAIVLALATTAGQVAGQGVAEALGAGAAPLEGISVSGSGWSQWRNTDEALLFLVDVLTTLLLTAAIVHHPVRRRLARTVASLQLPRLFLLYALIGMTVGFLVVQHGYIIGFVVFGIGALLRFRSNLDDPEDTVEMILVTVLGLCVGLDLPIMAILIGAVAWIVIWISARKTPCAVALQAGDAASLDDALGRVSGALGEKGWDVAATHRSHKKSSAEVIFLASGAVTEPEIENVLDEALSGGSASWKMSF